MWIRGRGMSGLWGELLSEDANENICLERWIFSWRGQGATLNEMLLRTS